LEKAFVENAMRGKQDEKRVEKIMKSVKETKEGEEEFDERDLLLDEESADTREESKVEARELEKIIADKHSNFNQISRHYKLFEYVARADPDQVLRYVKTRSPSIQPLWMSDKGQPQGVPACPRCGSPRLFEFQIMPQIFDVLKELMLVDWSTISFYTCSGSLQGKPCYPQAKGINSEFSDYIEEFAFI
jgi:pre-rRNA-processing protein TSR4